MMFISDFKYALRLLIKKPSFSLLTIIVMATGMGLSLYLFSFLNAMAFKALPFEDGESIVVLNAYQKGVVDYGAPINLHDYYEIRTNVKGLSEFSAFKNISVNAAGRDGARRYAAVSAEPSIFKFTRTKPVLGREFTDAENRKGAEKVVVIGFDIWQNQFLGANSVIDQKLLINGVNHRIIGVMPKDYSFPNVAALWIPMGEDATRLNRGDTDSYFGLAHINAGASMDDINNQLDLIMQRIEEKYPKTNSNTSVYVDTLQNSQGARGEVQVIYAMYVVAIFLLFLASANVGNLLLSRAVERSKETAIRVALGAPRSRLISQMLWESIIICVIGGLVGLLATSWFLGALESTVATFFSDKPPFWWKFGIDAFTMKLFFIFVFSNIIITGFLPAWKNSGADFNTILRDGTRGALGKKAGLLNRLLVISQIFITITVLIIAGVILVGTFIANQVDYGVNSKDTLISRVMLYEADYDSAEKQVKFVETLQNRLENDSTIGDVMITSALPGMQTERLAMALEGKEYSEEGNVGYPRANYIVVTPGSLNKLGVELKQGRYFNHGDNGVNKKTVIVTDSFVSRHFPDTSPIGKRVRVVELDGEESNWLTIVGVVKHTIQGHPSEDSGKAPSVFRVYGQAPQRSINIALKMKLDTVSTIITLRKTLASIDAGLPAFRITTFEERLIANNAPMRFISTIFLLFGIAAAILAASGIYGVMSNTINQKIQEIGIKRALGAVDKRIMNEYIKAGMKQLLWGGIPGLIIGCGLGFGMSQSMGIENGSLFIIAIAIVTMITSVVIYAAYVPTKRVLKLEPSEALHYD
ncbi:ABC transporter permease [Colwelliaceae bacterium 6441]